MPASKRPTFLKRQKELQRVARAQEKRDARRARKHAKDMVSEEPEAQESDVQESDIQESEAPPEETE